MDLLTQGLAYWQAYGQFVLYALVVASAFKGFNLIKVGKANFANFWILVAILFAVL